MWITLWRRKTWAGCGRALPLLVAALLVGCTPRGAKAPSDGSLGTPADPSTPPALAGASPSSRANYIPKGDEMARVASANGLTGDQVERAVTNGTFKAMLDKLPKNAGERDEPSPAHTLAVVPASSGNGQLTSLKGEWSVWTQNGYQRWTINEDGTMVGKTDTWKPIQGRDGVFDVKMGTRTHREWRTTPSSTPGTYDLKVIDPDGSLYFQTDMKRVQ